MIQHRSLGIAEDPGGLDAIGDSIGAAPLLLREFSCHGLIDGIILDDPAADNDVSLFALKSSPGPYSAARTQFNSPCMTGLVGQALKPARSNLTASPRSLTGESMTNIVSSRFFSSLIVTAKTLRPCLAAQRPI